MQKMVERKFSNVWNTSNIVKTKITHFYVYVCELMLDINTYVKFISAVQARYCLKILLMSFNSLALKYTIVNNMLESCKVVFFSMCFQSLLVVRKIF